MKKKWLSLFMAVCMILSMVPLMVFADEPVEWDSGYCGLTTKWVLDTNLNLTISNTSILSGTMASYDASYDEAQEKVVTTAPWASLCPLIRTVTIDDGVTNVGDYAFYNCPNLTSVTLGKDVKTIGYNAFYGSGKLKSVSFPSSVTDIDDYAFAVSGLESAIFPNSLKTIGNSAFRYCSALNEISIPGSVTTIGGYAFSQTPWIQTQGDCVVVNGILLAYQGESTAVTIPQTVTSIADDAFRGGRVTGVTIGDQVTSIGNRAFANCRKLESVTIGANVTNIGDLAFSGCTNLSELLYNAKSVSAMETDTKAFARIGQAGTGVVVTFGKTVNKLPTNLFYTAASSDAPNVAQMNFLGNAPSIGANAFYQVTTTARYPEGNTSWSASVRKNYGGTITWVEAPAAPVSSIAVNSTEHKTVYQLGEPLDVSQLTILATRTDGSKREVAVTASMVSGFDSSTVADSRTLTITYEGKTTSYSIRVANGVKSIAIQTPAEKLDYEVGDALDVSGLTIEVTMLDNSTSTMNVTADMISGFNSGRATAAQTLTITYQGKTATYDICIFGEVAAGDLTGDGDVTDADAIYLMHYVQDAGNYPLNQSADFTGDGNVTKDDAVYLLNYTLQPERYPMP